MGTWGVAIFSDDLAADIRGDFRELIGDGLTPSEATDRLKSEYASSLDDPNEMPVFWIALALAQWKLGRLDENTKKMALQVIDDGTDLARWDDEKSRAKRATVLAKTRAELLAALPPAKRVPRTIREANEWQLGETIGFQLLSGKWTMFRVIGHHTDKGGRFAVCELLDWVGEAFPSKALVAELQIKKEDTPRGISQFLFQEPRKKREQARVVRLGITTTPQQKLGGYTALIWPYVDNQLKEIFGLH
jgi:hypothetical protein